MQSSDDTARVMDKMWKAALHPNRLEEKLPFAVGLGMY